MPTQARKFQPVSKTVQLKNRRSVIPGLFGNRVHPGLSSSSTAWKRNASPTLRIVSTDERPSKGYDTHCGGGSETPLRLRWQHSAPSSEVHPLRPPLASFPHVSSALSHQCAMLLRLGICALCLHRAWSVEDDEKHSILSTVVLISVLVCPLHVELP
jgi:hypothetical protein